MKKIVNILLVVFVVTVGAAFIIPRSKSSSFVYIDVKKAIKDFGLTKEFDLKLQQSDQKRKQLLDSLQFDAEMASRKFLSDSTNLTLKEIFLLKRDGFLSRQNQYQEDQQTQFTQYNEQVLKQVNQYAVEFRNVKGYPIILGASGNGSIMSADKSFDVTDEFIEYINAHYNGKK